MATDPARIDFRLMSDPRLAAGVSGAVAHIAVQMGFSADEGADLAAVVGEASRDAFPLLTDPDGMVGVTLEQFPDRIEIVVEHEGQALPAAGLDTFAFPGAAEAAARGLSGLSLLRRVDRVQYDTQGGVSRMKLIKYLPANSGTK